MSVLMGSHDRAQVTAGSSCGSLLGRPGEHVTHRTPCLTAPCNVATPKKKMEKLTHLSCTGNQRTWAEVAGGGRNFPFVKVKGFGRRLGAAGGGSSLLTSNHNATHRPASERANIPNILILGVHLSIPKKTRTRSFPEDFLKIKPQNKSLYLYPPDLLAS